MKMYEIRIHGRGGQGAVTAAQILAIAAFHQGKNSQAFPRFGTERRGAPVESFARIDDKTILIRSAVYKPDVVIVQDPSLLKSIDVTKGLKKNGILIINSSKKLEFKGFKTYCIDATDIALKIFGRDMVNTVMLGALAAVSEIVDLNSINKGIRDRFEGKESLIEKNKQAVKEVYEKLK